MINRSRIGGLLIAMAATASLGISSTATANGLLPRQDRVAGAHTTTQARTVTLVSGDRVTVLGNGSVAVAPRSGVNFLIKKTKEHHYVIPTDALPLLSANRLDRRLFDVAALLEAGYDKRDSVPLIVAGTAAVPAGLTKTRSLKATRGMAAKAPVAKLAEVWKGLKGARSSAYQKIWLDGLRKPSLDVSVPQIGAPSAWASGLDGAGVKVAVLDTGIDPAHPDMLGKILAEKNFAGEYEDELDRVGHGTHVASTIAGTGAASGGKYKGVAPGASLLDGKVCFSGGCAESWILDGMQWAADNGAHVVNMSLGGDDTPEIDPIEQAVNDLSVSHGMLFVIAAGNSGPGTDTLGSPASADAALAVGAVDKSDVLAEFSSRGPRIGDAALKPEITGPGVDIVAANSKDGFLGEPGESYTTLSGTSMATPHVAGAAAILTQQHPMWTAQQRKSALMATANPNAADNPFAQGAGRVDVARAITQNVTSNPAAVSLGRQSWPHDDDTPDTRTVTYHNGGTTDLTLQLALQTPAPAGMFALSATSVTVAAGADASVTLTSDTRVGGDAIGHHGGQLTATAAGVRVQTPFAVDREGQRFGLDLAFTARGTDPVDFSVVDVMNVVTGQWDWYFTDEAVLSLRLAPGDYLVSADILESSIVTRLTWPRMTLAADQTMQMDARLGRGFDITIPDTRAQDTGISHTFDYDFEAGGLTSIISSPLDTLYVAQLGPKPVAGLKSSVAVDWAVPGPDGTLDNSPTVYSGAWGQDGSLIEGLVKHVQQADFARIDDTYAQHTTKGIFHARGAEFGNYGVASVFFLQAPFQRTAYVTTGTPWYSSVEEAEDWFETETRFFSATKSYVAGQRYAERWNRAVYGPGFPAHSGEWSYIDRVNDYLYAEVPLITDSQGNAGYGRFTSARTALYHNGKLFDEVSEPYARFTGLPAERSRYRLESTLERGAPATLSTKVHAVWEFRSQAGDVGAPVTAFGFAPTLDDQNRARIRQVMAVSVAVYQQKGAQSLRTLTVQMSTDDGATWRRVPVVSIFGMTFVVITNPAKAGFVSLRAQAEDRGGNTVDQTIIRAYAVK